MKEIVKPSYARFVLEMLKADKVVDEQEVEMLNKLCGKRGLERKHLVEAQSLTLSEAHKHIAESCAADKKNLISDIDKMSIIDNNRSREEALLLLAVKMCLADEKKYSIVSVPSGAVDFAQSQVVYLENGLDKRLNAVIKERGRELSNALRVAGFEFIHIPAIAQHYASARSEFLKTMVAYMSPTLGDGEIDRVIEMLRTMTTQYFKTEILESRLGFNFPVSKPSLLIKLGRSAVNGVRHSDFLQMRVTHNIVDEVNALVDAFEECGNHGPVQIKNVKDEKGTFVYDGFYKTIFDMVTYRRGSRSRIVINPLARNHRLVIESGEKRYPLELGFGESALYVYLLCESLLSADGSGANFRNLGNQSCKQIKARYGAIYEKFIQRDAPDITSHKIRNPMISRIKRVVKECGLSDDKALFCPHADENRAFQIAVEMSQVQVVEDGQIVAFENSDLRKVYERAKQKAGKECFKSVK
ncbi:MAG: hypothetical protein IKZ14_07185 [Muribaculaceae bacterium]|nr:hypothetical protein [Muribaculaceae bacterium]